MLTPGNRPETVCAVDGIRIRHATSETVGAVERHRTPNPRVSKVRGYTEQHWRAVVADVSRMERFDSSQGAIYAELVYLWVDESTVGGCSIIPRSALDL